MKRIWAFAAALAITVTAGATPSVVWVVTETTGAVIQTGQLVAGSTHNVTVRLADGAWPEGSYSLTVKPDGVYDGTAFAVITGTSWTRSGADLTALVDLNVTELYTYLGRADARMVMIEFADADAAWTVRHRVVVANSVRRPGDTAPANPDANTYTDSEVDAMIDAIPAGVSPVAGPIDGWTVQCTDDGQLEIGPVAAVQIVRSIEDYPECTTLATGDYLLLWDASEQALRKVSLLTVLNWVIANLP